MLIRLRQNLLLKVISLATSILLYYFVQAERNPTVTRQFLAAVHTAHVPPDVDVESDQYQFAVSVTGPHTIVDTLKDTDVQAIADLGHIGSGEQRVPIQYRVPRLPRDSELQLTFDPAAPLVRFQIYPPHLMTVSMQYPNEPPPGFRYGHAEAHPARVKIVGNADHVTRVTRLVVNAAPSEIGIPIDGDFPVSARDADGIPVTGVSIVPPTVHVTVPLTIEPSTKVVPISPDISDLPLPPYRITSITVTPRQVKIAGRPETLNATSTLLTQAISVRDLAENREFKTGLVTPADVTVYDPAGRPLHTVAVRIGIGRATEPSSAPSRSSSPNMTSPPSTPKEVRP